MVIQMICVQPNCCSAVHTQTQMQMETFSSAKYVHKFELQIPFTEVSFSGTKLRYLILLAPIPSPHFQKILLKVLNLNLSTCREINIPDIEIN